MTMNKDVIRRGYPNPNYTEEDIRTEEEAELLTDVGLVTIEGDHYEKLVSKAAALDILTADIKNNINCGVRGYSMVDNDLVMAVTGMKTYKAAIEKMEEGKNGAD